jgi:class III cytochrome C family protein
MSRARARVFPPLLLVIVVGGGGGAARAQDFFQQSPGPLSAAHASLEGQDNCLKCHTNGKDLAIDKCTECHKEQKAKIEAGRGFHSTGKVKGKPCWACHLEHKGKQWDEMGWAALGGRDKFDHAATDFPLHGKHAAVACEKCHARVSKQGLRLFLGEQAVCGSCHKKDDPHNSSRAELLKCDRCHTDVAWQPPRKPLDFDHNDRRQAGYPLEGNHADVACAKCHPKAQFHFAAKDATACAGCHPDPHKGQLFDKKPCDLCHSPKFQTVKQFFFDHGKNTKFKLEGKHAQLACASCHLPGVVKKPDKACEICHAKDNKHKERFAAFGKPAPLCATCHNQVAWKPQTQFDHAKATRFVLTGKHALVACRACHRGKTPDEFERFEAKTVGCMGCHQHAVVHERKFKDSDCLTCHKTPGSVEYTAGAVDKFHGPRAQFPLNGAHLKVTCDKCHKNNQWKGISMECGPTCHEDSLHRGALGTTCSSCHQGGRWEAVRFNHQKTSYPLVGQHLKVACIDCHPQRHFKPTATTCGAAGCHQKDDVHGGALGQKCERCHKETGDNLFNHNRMAAFRLENAHLSTACARCHPTMNFKPRPKDCFGCHPEPEVHKGKFGTACENCHTTVTWKGTAPIHDVGNFSLAGAHDNLACDRCHGKELRPLAGTGNLCVTCHRGEDIHSGSLGPKCGTCHTQWSFAPAKFEHLTVGCNLRGIHRVLACFDCHKAGNFGGLSPQCFGCHRDDALTRGQQFTDHTSNFDCGMCHNINFWDRAQTAPAGSSSVCR